MQETRRLISIFLAGVQKSGTTSLFSHLCDHPELSQPSVKELHFFDDESENWQAPDYARMDRYFDPGDSAGLRFDATPIYSFWPPSIARIQAYNRQAKLILVFRDPFDRAWSQWCFQYKLGYETLPFDRAIRDGRRRLDDSHSLSFEHRLFSYIERGMYAGQVERVLDYFPREQVLFLRSDDLMADYKSTLKRIATFLDIGSFPDKGPKRENLRPTTTYPLEPTQDDLNLIVEMVADDVSRFSRLTGIDVSDWTVMRSLASLALKKV